MEKLPEVEAAKALMNEAMTWSVMKWLREKKTVRRTADRANDALDQLSRKVKARWSDVLRAADEALVVQVDEGIALGGRRKPSSSPIEPKAKLIVQKIKEAYDEVYRSRMDAEETFDEAERRLSTSLAREGCRKAIHGWDLHEKAILRAEAVIHPS
jgi:hypothetical protein